MCESLLGGGMRQAGILAAAGLWAVDDAMQRLTEDHATGPPGWATRSVGRLAFA